MKKYTTFTIMNRKYRQKKYVLSYHLKKISVLLVIIAIVWLIYIQLNKEVMPTLITMSELQGTTIATQALNQAISNTLSENQTYIDDLLRYDYNEAGELISWNVNAIVINQICAQIVSESMDALENIGTLYLPVPLGQLTGNKFLANTGPRLKIRVLPLGTVEANYENDICSTGINQVNHTVWLNVEATVQVVVPLFTNQVKVQRRVVLVDKVISGTVPPTYLNISEGSVWSDLTGTTSKKE